MISKGTDFFKQQSKRKLVLDNKLKQVNFLNNRVYQREPDLYYPSVTTILQYFPKNKFFENWMKDVGHNSDLIMRKAGREGTQVHEAMEKLVLGEELNWIDQYGNAAYSELVWSMICRFVDFWTYWKPTLVEVEVFSYSDENQYAGTIDLIVEKDNKTWLLDVKTSNTLHRSYELQLAAYSKAWEEMGNKPIDETGIIWLKSSKRSYSKDPKKIQGKGWELKHISDIDNNFKLFTNVYEMYKLENPDIKPLYRKYPTVLKL